MSWPTLAKACNLLKKDMPTFSFYLPRPDRLYTLFRSRFRRPDIDIITVQEVLGEYGLDLVDRPYVPGGRGRSRSLIVSTCEGKKVFKRYVSSTALPTIVHEHSILKHLALVGFSSPRLVVTRSGETIVNKGGSQYALFDFIEGGFHYHNYLLLPAQAREFIAVAGQTLAALHCRLQDFVPEGQNPNGFRSRTEDWWRDLEWCLTTLAHCVQETQSIESVPQAAEVLAQATHMEKSLVDSTARSRQPTCPA